MVRTWNPTCSRNRHIQSFSAKRVLADPLEYPFLGLNSLRIFCCPRCTPGCSAGGQHTIVRCSAGEMKYHYGTWTWDPSWLLNLMQRPRISKQLKTLWTREHVKKPGFSMDCFRFRSFYQVINQALKLRSKCQAGQSVAKAWRISHNFVLTPEVQYNFTPFVLSCTWLISTFEGHDGGGGGQARREGCVSMGSLAWGGSLQQYYAWICNWHATWTHSESCRENHSGRTPGLYGMGTFPQGMWINHDESDWSVDPEIRVD